MERPGARAGRASGEALGPGSPRRDDGGGVSRTTSESIRPGPARRRGARRSARRRRGREHVACRGSLARSGLAVAAGRGGERRRARTCAQLGSELHAGRCCGGSSSSRRLSTCRQSLPPMRRAGALARARRCQPNGVLVPGMPTAGQLSEGGEGGIRTLEAGFSPPNALAGRRLQPLGHFSGNAQDIGLSRRSLKRGRRGTRLPCSSPRRGAGAAERGGLENR